VHVAAEEVAVFDLLLPSCSCRSVLSAQRIGTGQAVRLWYLWRLNYGRCFENSCHAQPELWYCLCTPRCMQDLPVSYIGTRLGAWSQLQAAATQLQPSAAGLPYTAMFLLDQAAAAGLRTQPGATASPSSTLQPAWAAAALLVADEATRLQVAPGAPSAGSAPALSEAAVAGHFEVSTEALQAAVVTLREACGQACLLPITPYMMLELYTKVLSAGCMEYQVCAG